MLAKGIKKQVFGGVLISLGAMTVLLARIIGFEPDRFYIALIIIGACLFLYGVIQARKQILTSEPVHICEFCTEPITTDGIQPHHADIAVCADLESHSASLKQSISVLGN